MRKNFFIGILVGGLLTTGILGFAESARDKFHADVAHALLEMHEALDKIAEYHAKGTMPPNKDELHEKAAHGFKKAIEHFGVKTKKMSH